jgi:hypothetical protein
VLARVRVRWPVIVKNRLFEALQLRSEEDVINVTFPTVLILGQK